ncbi:hypothetical protein Adt_15808 [Abeliophyllum distichum]|uniref:Uncharacterized protein n=1 Tax=Abeliophyllum distichum TaxID=126358 RepID=A0ABD1U3I4_9LAMI
MINYNRFSPTSEETRSWQPNNNLARGSTFNARTAQDVFAQQASLKRLPHWDSAKNQLVPPRKKPRSSASTTGTRSAISLFHPRNKHRSSASPTGTRPHISLFYKGTSLDPAPLPLGLGHKSACSTKEQVSIQCLSHWNSVSNQLVPPKEQASLRRLSHWDSATYQLVPPRNKPRSSASPTGTRSAISLFHPRNKHRSSASPTGTRSQISLFHQGTSLDPAPPPLGLSFHPRNKPRSRPTRYKSRPVAHINVRPQTLWDLFYL